MSVVKKLAIPFFLSVYQVDLLLMSQVDAFPLEEALSIFIILGCLFSPIAYLVSRSSQPLELSPGAQPREGWLLVGLFVYISVVLLFGSASVVSLLSNSIRSEASTKEIVSLLFKLVVFVAIPFFIYKLMYGFDRKDFGWINTASGTFTKKNLLIFSVMAGLFLILQWFGGRAAAPVRNGEFSGLELTLGLPLAFLWLLFEVGLVEEFFFRALLQDRLSVLMKSSWWAIVVSSLLFGIAHAPGMYFRGAGDDEGIGMHPSFFVTVGYCIAVQSAAGIPFAIVWSKTRNLWLVMAIHASVDLFSNFPSLFKDFAS